MPSLFHSFFCFKADAADIEKHRISKIKDGKYLTSLKFPFFFYQYENEKIWGKSQRDCTPTTRKTEAIYKSKVSIRPSTKVENHSFRKALNRLK